MDILRKELGSIYAAQYLESENLDAEILRQCKEKIVTMASVSNACYVITDASADMCFIYAGSIACLLGFSRQADFCGEYDSSDEDIIYNCIHPEDLVEKRMLEYDFFKFVDKQNADDKQKYVATCRIRIRNLNGEYVYVNNTTRIMHKSPKGKMWLILCSYELSPDQSLSSDISPKIVNNCTGSIMSLTLIDRRNRVLSNREKEILLFIRDGKSSKQIADELSISIHTVNRHRQNILEKLSVGNSHEAIVAATEMRLL